MSRGYLDQKREARLERLLSESPARIVHRFDLGQNNDGCAPEVARHLAEVLRAGGAGRYLKDYPPCESPRLRERIAALHGVDPERVVVTAGVEQAIGLVADALVREGDRVAVAEPSFFVFEEFSVRRGARALRVELDEADGFAWSPRALAKLDEVVRREAPRVIWLADPNNPTGRALPQGAVAEIAGRLPAPGQMAGAHGVVQRHGEVRRGVVLGVRSVEPQAAVAGRRPECEVHGVLDEGLVQRRGRVGPEQRDQPGLRRAGAWLLGEDAETGG